VARPKKDPKPKTNSAAQPVRLDLGCGPNKREGFIGVDVLKFGGKVDIVFDLGNVKKKFPWKDDSVDEIHCSHMVEHLTWVQRVHFFNELWRVMKVGAKAQVIMPHWCSSRYYGDPTHKEPMSEWAWFYMDADWRKSQAPHDDAKQAGKHPLAYICDFASTVSYGLHQALQGRNPESINYAIQFYKEACTDMIVSLTKKPSPKALKK
jgi:predicted SAM-dependent methyltransferase